MEETRRKLAVLSGDARTLWAVKALRQAGVQTASMEVPGCGDTFETLEETLQEATTLLLPMGAFSKGMLEVRGQRITLCRLAELCGDSVQIIGGRLEKSVLAACRELGLPCTDYTSLESFQLANAAVTAEGAVQTAMVAMDRTVYGAQALVIGYGRIGRFLAQKLAALGAKSTVAARRQSQRTEIELSGMESDIPGIYRRGLRQYDLICNTVPACVLRQEHLNQMSRQCVLLELASAPGGLQHAAVPEMQYLKALGLPGKTAPRTAGQLLADAVQVCMEREGRDHDA